MGGMHGFGAVDVAAEASGLEGWETRLQALALASRGVTRAGIEALEPATYLGAGYHERWLLCSERSLITRGKIDESDLDAWRARFSADGSAQMPVRRDPQAAARVEAIAMSTPLDDEAIDPTYSVGQYVRVRRMRPEAHHRCPRYVRGAVGSVERVVGNQPRPGTRPSPETDEPVYTVSFSSVDLWGERTDDGEPPYEVLIDLWQSYLEAP